MRIRLIVLLAVVAALAAGAALRFVLPDSPAAPMRVSVDADDRLQVSDLRATSTATPASAPRFPTSDAPVARLSIPSIGVDRATVPGLVDTRKNEMIAPRNPFDVAYYTYSARPGQGNAVFSGHVDHINVGPAVFWSLSKLRSGDMIEITLADGAKLKYQVAFNRTFDADTGPWEELFGPDAAPDAVTLYTCDGTFDSATQNYAGRRVVRADRVG